MKENSMKNKKGVCTNMYTEPRCLSEHPQKLILGKTVKVKQSTSTNLALNKATKINFTKICCFKICTNVKNLFSQTSLKSTFSGPDLICI